MSLLVIKRDGSEEDFSTEKLHRVVTAAGLTEAKAQIVIEKLKDWASKVTTTSVTSLEIRDQVLKELTEVDNYAANMFSWYQKTKEKTPKLQKQ